MKKLLLLQFIIICFFYGCRKDVPAVISNSNKAPTTNGTTTGTGPSVIQGVISPADAVNAIVIYDQNSNPHVVKPDADGKFVVNGLSAGTYFINYNVTLAYTNQPSKTLLLSSGQTLDLGKLTFSPGTGIIDGIILPVGAASKVSLTDSATKATYSVIPDQTSGKYMFANVPGSVYTVTYTAANNAVASASQRVVLSAGQNMHIPVIIFKTPGVTGTISGLADAKSIGSVFLSNSVSSYGVIVYPDPTGKFTSPDLIPGTYKITFNSRANYRNPQDTVVNLANGQQLDIGSIKAPLFLSRIPFTINGANTVIGLEATNCHLSGMNLKIGASNSSGIPELPAQRSILQIAVDNVTGPGTYILQGTSTSFMSYSLGSPYKPSNWDMNNGGKATIIITGIDPIQRVISGTFSATLKPASNASEDAVITNGVINLTY